jgi:transcriptional regulator with XRE-family HTH domain
MAAKKTRIRRRNQAVSQIGANIVAARKARNWSTERLAVEAGLPYHTVYAYERADREPKALAFCRLAKALGVPMEALMSGVEFQKIPA